MRSWMRFFVKLLMRIFRNWYWMQNFVKLLMRIFRNWYWMGFTRNRNWCLLQNRPLQYRLLQYRFLQYRPQVKYPVGIDMKSLKVVSSSKGVPKSSIGLIFSDWIFFIFFQKSHEIFAWGFSSYRLGLSVEPRHEDGVFSAGLRRPRHEVFPD